MRPSAHRGETEEKRKIAEDALSRFSYILRFKSEELEYRYVESSIRTEPKVYLLFWVWSTAGLAVSMASHFFYDLSGYGHAGYVLIISHVCMMLVNCTFIHLWRSPGSAVFKERVIVLLSFVWILHFLFWGNDWRMNALFNNNKEWHVGQHYSDVVVVTCSGIYACFVAVVLRIRTLKLGVLLIFIVVVYVAVSVPPGMCPDGYPYLLPVVFLLGVQYVWLFNGHTNHEKDDRINWHIRLQLQDEKHKLRAKLECTKSPYATLIEKLEKAIEEEDESAVIEAKSELAGESRTSHVFDVDAIVGEIKSRQSKERGVAASYILSDDFFELARKASGKSDPTFHELRDAFFQCDESARLGFDKVCPRDGKMGCALVDLLPREFRGKCTHFLSWTWHYNLSTVRSALAHWLASTGSPADEVFLFCCFFVNNQYRILYAPDQGDTKNAETLDETFGRNLNRIGQMVALLDTFDTPVYLSRIWTIFEQFTAIKHNIPVQIIMPPHAAAKLFFEIDAGKLGIRRVTNALCRVDSRNAQAFSEKDAELVKCMIENSVGFDMVDEEVISHLLKWVGAEVQLYMKEIVTNAAEKEPSLKMDRRVPRIFKRFTL